MKKILAFILVAVMMLALVACNNKPATDKQSDTNDTTSTPATTENQDTAEDTDESTDTDEIDIELEVMTYKEFVEAELDSLVIVETFVQAKQSWWDNKGTFYTQSPDGAYFLYNMACTEEEYNQLVPGTKILVAGFKAEWSGEIEIVDASFQIIEGETYIAEPKDVTDLLGTDELIDYQNQFVIFSGLTVKSIAYKNDEPGDDIYVTFTKGDVECQFCVEAYLTGPDTDLYEAVGELKEGDVVDVAGFLYWYEGANTHIVAIQLAGE